MSLKGLVPKMACPAWHGFMTVSLFNLDWATGPISINYSFNSRFFVNYIRASKEGTESYRRIFKIWENRMKSVKARKGTSIADYFIKKTDSNKNIPKDDSKVIADAIVDLTIEVLGLLL